MFNLGGKLGEWILARRWWIIIVTLLLLLAAIAGTQKLSFTNDNRVFFSEENPQLKALEALERRFSKDQNVIFLIVPKNGDVFDPLALQLIEKLTKDSWQIPYSSRVDSITNFQHTQVANDELKVSDLVEGAESLSSTELHRIKGVALSEPRLVNRLISPNGQVTGINVTIRLPGKSLAEAPEVTAFARELAEATRLTHPDVDVYLAGGVILDNAFAEVSQRDMATLVPLMFLTLIILVGLALRSFSGTFATLVIILMSMMTAMGLAGWLGITMTSASANAPHIIMTLAVADSVHILATVLTQLRLGRSKADAIVHTLKVNLQAVFLTSITTAIGFLSMNFSDAPPFRDLGNIVAMGVIVAFLYSILFLPALLSVLPLKSATRMTSGEPCKWLADFVITWRVPLLWGSNAAVIIFGIGLLKIELNDNFVEYFSERYEIRRNMDFMEANLSGADVIEYSLDSGEPGGVNTPEYLANVERFAEWYRRQAKVVHVNSITDTVKQLNQTMHSDNPAYYRIPQNRELIAQYLLLYELSLPYGMDLNNQIDVDKASTRMSVNLRDMTTTEIREMDKRARSWLRANTPASMFTYGTGLSITWAHITERNINSMLGASFGALVLISLILIIAFQDIKLGLISLLPNLIPAFAAFGIWGLFMGRVGLGLSVVVSLTLGIVVDDTVHFLSKYLHARRLKGYTPRDAVRYAFNTVGTAMWVTTVALLAGFGVLSISGYRMNAEMGLLTAITIALALVMDFLLLPPLLITLEERKYESTKNNSNAESDVLDIACDG
ncbi:RND transporter [bacterium M21]|nr:RND transporter [bacterium M21]